MQLGHTLGIFAGSMTSTATLQAALDVMGNKDPSIGYSVAYPFGVIGPILCFYFLTRKVQADLPAQARALPHGRGHDRTAARRHGTLGDLVKCVARRRAGLRPCGRTTRTACRTPELGCSRRRAADRRG